jgi:HSP90 family molecular chaperone
MLAKKSLELNPHHPIMKVLLQKVKDNDGQLDNATLEYVDLLYQMALLNSGFNNDEPTELTTPLEKLIRVGFGVDREAPIEEIEIELEQEAE